MVTALGNFLFLCVLLAPKSNLMLCCNFGLFKCAVSDILVGCQNGIHPEEIPLKPTPH